jgi:predicted ribosome quality control (RQC) complex YloA/Tae2 family protein
MSKDFTEIETDTFVYWLGKNAKGNDEIIRKANHNDICFHLDNISSAHLILKVNDTFTVDKHILLHCAQILKETKSSIAYQKVNICYTQISNLKRTKKLGEVTFKNQSMVFKVKKV